MPDADAQLDAARMARAIRLAMDGRGQVEPNPMVGCVIARGGEILGEGYHQKFGGPHAEPEALAACAAAGRSPTGATAYITLEPCCHTNKKTPPCVPRLIEAKVARVVVGCVDPNPQVSGRGLEMLRAAGIETTQGVLEAGAKQLLAPFIARVSLRRPYVTLKWAESADGKVAGPGGKPVRISNEASWRLVHALRARSDAILVAVGTVLSDDPLLTARGVTSCRPLRRMVLDSHLRIPVGSRLVRTAPQDSLAVYSAEGGTRSEREMFLLNVLHDLGVEVYPLPADANGHPSLPYLLGAMDIGVTHLLVEAGPKLARSFFSGGLVDRVWVIRSPKSIGAETAPAAAAVPPGYVVTGELDLEGDRLTEYLNPHSVVYSAPVASADLVGAGVQPDSAAAHLKSQL